MRIHSAAACAAILTLSFQCPVTLAIGPEQGVDALLGNAITYQGNLDDNGAPADGTFDMRFSLFSSSGVQINSPVTYIGVQVSEGMFTVDLDFDQAIWTDFADIEKYLQIEVRTNGGGGYTALAPRTLLASAPHANVAQIAHRLSFPYTESITGFTSNDTAFDLSVNQGTALRLHSSNLGGAPALFVEGDNPLFLPLSDHIALFNDRDAYMGIISIADRISIAGFNASPNGYAAVLGEIGSTGTPSATAIRAHNFAADTFAYLAQENYAGLFEGDVHVDSGQVTKDFSNSPSPVGPIAYGSISTGGTPTNATANLSCTWNAAAKTYEITLSDSTFSFGNTTAIVTVVDTAEPRVATTNVSGSLLLVKIWDINSGNIAVSDNFQIVIYQAQGPGLLRSSVPAGMDPEYYYQQTGTTPPQVPYAPAVEIPEPISVIRD